MGIKNTQIVYGVNLKLSRKVKVPLHVSTYSPLAYNNHCYSRNSDEAQ